MFNKYTFLIFSFIITTLCYGNDDATGDNIGLREELLTVYDTLREIKKSGGFELVPISKEDSSDFNFCISCDSVSPLVSEINKILQVVAEEEDRKDPELRTVETVSGLDAMYHYTMEEGIFDMRGKCERFIDSTSGEGKEDFELENATILFSNEIPLSNINALHMRDGKKRTYFYRGKEEDKDVVVRVDVLADDTARVSYYKIKKNEASEAKANKKNFPKKKRSKDVWEMWASSSDESESEDDDENQSETVKGEDVLDYGIGISIEHKSNIPKKITLIKGSSFTSVASTFAVKTNTEISTKKQILSMSLSSTEGDDFAKVDVEKDLIELQIPTNVELFSSGLNLATTYSINSDNEQKVDLSLGGEEGTTTSLTLQRDTSGNSASLSRIQRISESQKVSIQLKSPSSGSDEAWVRYELTF